MSQESFDDFPQWRSDIYALLRLAQISSASTNDYRGAEGRYFEGHYSDASLRQHQRQRVTAALRWLDANSSEIARRAPTYVIHGDGEVQVEDRVVFALFAVFSRCPLDRLNESFPVDSLLGYLE